MINVAGQGLSSGKDDDHALYCFTTTSIIQAREKNQKCISSLNLYRNNSRQAH